MKKLVLMAVVAMMIPEVMEASDVDGTAEVRFLVKDAVTIKGVPMRWLMQVEDGQWKVANIFFEKDDNFDILMNMRAYVDDAATTGK